MRRSPYVLWTALILSVLVNLFLVSFEFVSAIDRGHLDSDQASTWRYLSAERAEMQELRAHFCPGEPAPDRIALLAWERQSRPASDRTEPFDKDGLLWLREVSVKFDADDRLIGICPHMTWQMLDRPGGEALDNAGAGCPLEPLC